MDDQRTRLPARQGLPHIARFGPSDESKTGQIGEVAPEGESVCLETDYLLHWTNLWLGHSWARGESGAEQKEIGY